MLVKIMALLTALSILSSCKPRFDESSGLSNGDLENGKKFYGLFAEHKNAKNSQESVIIEEKIYGLAVLLSNTGKLQSSILALFDAIEAKTGAALLKDLKPEQKADLAGQLSEALLSESIKTQSRNKDKRWKLISDQINTAAKIVNIPKDPWNSKSFIEKIQKIAGSRFNKFEEAVVLASGPKSFPKRFELIKNAKSRIWIFSWAFYDDFTGTLAADKLIEAKNERGIDVRVIVDGLTADRSFTRGVIKKLLDGGIPVVLWRSQAKAFNGMHRKVMIADDQHVIGGGMNFGDEYSHLGPKTDPIHKWRDTDLYVKSIDLNDSIATLFSETWNSYLAEFPNPRLTPINLQGRKSKLDLQGVMIVDHEPARPSTDPIYALTIAAIRAAKSSILISNAYYIATPAISDALVEAKRANPSLEVALHTNSSDSVDVPTLIRPIYRGLSKLLSAGIKVHVHKGTTLHSKYLVIDEHFGWIGSYNLHPRSNLYDSEAVLAFNNKRIGSDLAQQFRIDIGFADMVKSAKEVEVPASQLSDFAERFFFDQL